jgi:hypothetical protein
MFLHSASWSRLAYLLVRYRNHCLEGSHFAFLCRTFVEFLGDGLTPSSKLRLFSYLLPSNGLWHVTEETAPIILAKCSQLRCLAPGIFVTLCIGATSPFFICLHGLMLVANLTGVWIPELRWKQTLLNYYWWRKNYVTTRRQSNLVPIIN